MANTLKDSQNSVQRVLLPEYDKYDPSQIGMATKPTVEMERVMRRALEIHYKEVLNLLGDQTGFPVLSEIAACLDWINEMRKL